MIKKNVKNKEAYRTPLYFLSNSPRVNIIILFNVSVKIEDFKLVAKFKRVNAQYGKMTVKEQKSPFFRKL